MPGNGEIILPGAGERRHPPTTREFDIKVGVMRDAPFAVAFQCGDLYTTFEPELAEALATQLRQAAVAVRLSRAQRAGELPKRGG